MPGASAQPVSAHYSLRQIGQGGAVTSQIHATVTIETPVEKVLEFVDDPENLAKCAPMVERVMEVGRSGRRVGNSFRVIWRSQIFLELGGGSPLQVDCGPSIELAHGSRTADIS